MLQFQHSDGSSRAGPARGSHWSSESSESWIVIGPARPLSASSAARPRQLRLSDGPEAEAAATVTPMMHSESARQPGGRGPGLRVELTDSVTPGRGWPGGLQGRVTVSHGASKGNSARPGPGQPPGPALDSARTRIQALQVPSQVSQLEHVQLRVAIPDDAVACMVARSTWIPSSGSSFRPSPSTSSAGPVPRVLLK